jgi:DegV family protein with EDD domain
MDIRIVADSCCDLTDELKTNLGVTTVPLTMTLGEAAYADDDTLDLPLFMKSMKACQERIGSAAPNPALYEAAFRSAKESYAVTISSNLSGSYSNALLGKSLAEERGASVHVFDSKSASAGEALLIVKLRRLVRAGLPKTEIIPQIERFISEMKTLFVLDNIDTLLKNGRLGRVAGKLISTFHIRPILGSDGNGNISLFSHAQGWKQALKKLVNAIGESGRPTEGETMVIAHCRNALFAQELKQAIETHYRFSEIIVLPTRGLSSVYANEKGVIIAF